MGWMWFSWILIAVFIAAVLWMVLRSTQGPRGPRGGGGEREGAPDRPEEVLKRRYARGEIDRETFHRTLKELRT